MVYGQLESAWPVPGTPLVEGDEVYCVAGRSSYLDDGVYLYRLDAETGEKLSQKRIYSRDPETGAQLASLLRDMGPDDPWGPDKLDMGGAKPDILSANQGAVFMRHTQVDGQSLEPLVEFQDFFSWQDEGDGKKRLGHPRYQNPEHHPHLFSPTGFRDDSWWRRTYWLYGTYYEKGFRPASNVPAGRIMSLDDTMAYGYGRRPEFWGWRATIEYQLFAAPQMTEDGSLPGRSERVPRDFQGRFSIGPFGTRVQYAWTRTIPFFARALIATRGKIVAAGPPDVQEETEVNISELMHDADLVHRKLDDYLAAWNGEMGGRLWVFSKKDGTPIRKYDVDFLPQFDGMAAARGRLYVATEDGRLLCLGGTR
jgi:hypothetical protein